MGQEAAGDGETVRLVTVIQLGKAEKRQPSESNTDENRQKKSSAQKRKGLFGGARRGSTNTTIGLNTKHNLAFSKDASFQNKKLRLMMTPRKEKEKD